MAGRTLHVRCATWEQVHVFTTRKLRKGKSLSMKVPFVASVGAQVTLGLELPNALVIAIDGIVQKASPVEVDGKIEPGRTWVEVELVGFTEDVRARIATLAKQDIEAQAKPQAEAPPPPPASREDELHAPAPPALARRSTTQMGEELPADERELFQHLSAELRRLRQAAVHDVLGVSPAAGPEEVRSMWKELIRRHHPDLVSRRNAPAISHLAEELTILANRAYDRMRAKLVAEGRGAVAGPAITSPPGWLVAFEDIQSSDGVPAPVRGPRRFDRPGSREPSEPVRAPTPAASGQGSDAFEQRARASLGIGDTDTAREVLAAALVVYPRSKPLRSLYYVATALAALHDGEVMLATTQLETALAHHEHCVEAAKMLEHIRKHGTKRSEEMRRLFL